MSSISEAYLAPCMRQCSCSSANMHTCMRAHVTKSVVSAGHALDVQRGGKHDVAPDRCRRRLEPGLELQVACFGMHPSKGQCMGRATCLTPAWKKDACACRALALHADTTVACVLLSTDRGEKQIERVTDDARRAAQLAHELVQAARRADYRPLEQVRLRADVHKVAPLRAHASSRGHSGGCCNPYR